MIKAQNIKKQKSEDFEKYKKVLSDDISILKNLVSELG